MSDAETRTFRHDQTALEIPGDWVDDSVVRIRAGAGGDAPNLVIAKDRLRDDETLAAYAARNLEGLSKTLGELDVIERGSMKHAHFEEAYGLTYRWTMPNGKRFVQRQLIVPIVRKIFVLYGTAPEERFPDAAPSIDAALRSFRLEPD